MESDKFLIVDATQVRKLDTTVFVVGPSGPNADRVTVALEQARIRIVRLGSAAVACERVVGAMPQVIVLLDAISGAERDVLTDRSTAVGAALIDVESTLEGEAFEDVINDVITTAIQRKLLRDEVEKNEAKPAPGAMATEEIDGDWEE